MSYFGNFHMLEQTRVQVEKFDIGANKGVWAALVHCWLLFAPAFIKNNLCRREQTTILGNSDSKKCGSRHHEEACLQQALSRPKIPIQAHPKKPII